jgi:glycosyltransferase involved in cell wall biosynthesis
VVQNGALYLDAAIRSIVGQTWRDFEFVILDDGSTADTAAILERRLTRSTSTGSTPAPRRASSWRTGA